MSIIDHYQISRRKILRKLLGPVGYILLRFLYLMCTYNLIILALKPSKLVNWVIFGLIFQLFGYTYYNFEVIANDVSRRHWNVKKMKMINT